MRQGQQNRRGRGRPNNNRGKSQNPLTRSFQSNGPDVKIHGTPSHIAEKYVSLARDSLTAGDSVMAENYLQHAEHYNRIILTYREQQMALQDDTIKNGTQPRHGGRTAAEGAECAAQDGAVDEVEAGADTDADNGVQVRGSEPQPRMADASPVKEDSRGRRQGSQRGTRPPRAPRPPARRSDAANGNGEQPRASAQSRRRDRDAARISDGQDAPGFLRNPVARASRQRPAQEPAAEAAAAPAAKDDDS